MRYNSSCIICLNKFKHYQKNNKCQRCCRFLKTQKKINRDRLNNEWFMFLQQESYKDWNTFT